MRNRWLAAALLAASSFATTPGIAVADRVRDGEKDNYVLRLPDTFAFEDVAEAFRKQGAVQSGVRRLEKLSSGQPGNGLGARVLLFLTDAPKELDPQYEAWIAEWQTTRDEIARKTADGSSAPADLDAKAKETRAKIDRALGALAALPDVAGPFLGRFDADPKRWPKPTVGADRFDVSGLPGASLKVAAAAPNLDGTPSACDGRMFLTVIRKRLYRLVLWGWPTKPLGDSEGILADFDWIEIKGLEIPNKTAILPKPDPAPAAPPAAGTAPAPTAGTPGVPILDGDAAEEKRLDDKPFGIMITKPKKFRSLPIDRSTEADRFVGFRFRATDKAGSTATVDTLVYRITGKDTFDLDKYVHGRWADWMVTHPKGALGVLPFPAYSDKAPLLSLPDAKKRKDLTKEMRKKPPKQKDPNDPAAGVEEGSRSDVEKWGALVESKMVKVGKEKVGGAFRFAMTGELEPGVEETSVIYTFSTVQRTYIFRVWARGNGWTMFGPEIAQMLTSFEIQ